MRTDSSPSVISISATPELSINSMSFLTLRMSMTFSRPLVAAFNQKVQRGGEREIITMRPAAHDHTRRGGREQQLGTPPTTGENLADIHFKIRHDAGHQCLRR